MADLAPGSTRPGRGAELGLLALALLIAVYSYAQVGLNVTGALPADIAGYSGALAALVLVFHLILRWRAPNADPVILPCAVALNGIGLAMIYRLDFYYETQTNRPHDLPEKQLVWTAVSMVVAMIFIALLKDHRILRRFSYLAMLGGLILLLLPLVPKLGGTRNGATIWIFIGPFSFQPAELAKILLTVFFAGYLVTNKDTLALAGKRVLGLQLPRARDLGPILIAWGVSLVVLIAEKDLGTSLLFFGLFVAMLYMATDRLSWIIIGLIMFVGGVVAAFTAFSHVQARVDIWLDPFNQQIYERFPGGSRQLVQGMFGMANGGLFGTGWGKGMPGLISVAESDSIYAALGEELGLTGILAILMVLLILVERGFRTALGVRDGFGKLLAAGFAFVFAFQTFVVVGGVTRVIPMTGLTLPFVAYGGSSLVANWLIVALLLRVSDGARRPAPPTGELDLEPILAALDARAAEESAKEGRGRGDEGETEVVAAVDSPTLAGFPAEAAAYEAQADRSAHAPTAPIAVAAEPRPVYPTAEPRLADAPTAHVASDAATRSFTADAATAPLVVGPASPTVPGGPTTQPQPPVAAGQEQPEPDQSAQPRAPRRVTARRALPPLTEQSADQSQAATRPVRTPQPTKPTPPRTPPAPQPPERGSR